MKFGYNSTIVLELLKILYFWGEGYIEVLIIYRHVHKILSNNPIVLKFSQVMHLIKFHKSAKF